MGNSCGKYILGVDDNDSPLVIVKMKIEQHNDVELLDTQAKHQEMYIEKQIGDGHNFICYVKPENDPETQWTVALPLSMSETSIL